ncbi:MAG: conjugal transfer protein TraJ [Bacilli bacterium]|nr:conjugal transfer protein TraJ [Bacilli bacterium]
MKDEINIKQETIGIKCTLSEKEFIKNKAFLCGMKPSTYMRNLALNYSVVSQIDDLAFLELIKCRADLGRLGGLLKMWITNKNRRAGLNEIDIKDLLLRIEAKEEEMLDHAKRLKAKD